jgi:signal peptide peptidase SppA
MEHLNNPVYAWGGDANALTAIIKGVTDYIISEGPFYVESAATRRPYNVYGGVAVLHLRGPMMSGVPQEVEQIFSVTDTRRFARSLEVAADDKEVDSVAIIVNSPGGSVDGLNEIADAMQSVMRQKNVVAMVNGMAASAAYYAIAQAQTIYAGRMDLIGSIGTRLTVYDYSEAFANAGIKPVVIDTGEYKSMGEPGTEITDAHKAEFQRLVDGYFADFRQVVQRGRGLSDQSFEAIGDGRLFFAEESMRNGLIDGILKVSDVLNSMQAANAARRRIASI